MNNVTDRGTFDWTSVLRVPADAETVEAYSLRRGDVLFNNTNSTALVGKSALFTEYDEHIVYSNHFTRIRTDSSRLLPEFLALWLQFQWRLRLFENICNRWIGQSAVQRDKLLALEVPLPPIDEQARIAADIRDKFERIDRARAVAAAQLEAAKALPSAYLREVFESPEAQEWPIVTVGGIARLIVDGPHVTPTYQPRGVPFVTVRNIVRRTVDLREVSYISKEDHAEFSSRGRAERADILYTKDGTLGIPCVVDTAEEFSFFVSVALIKLKREIANSFFVACALESPQVLKQVGLLSAGAGLKHMVLKSIRSLTIPLPQLDRQETIAGVLRDKLGGTSNLTNLLDKHAAALGSLPARFLREAFHGTEAEE
jgi:type I restriction enzyme S subunit